MYAAPAELEPEPMRVFGSSVACAASAKGCPRNNESAGKCHNWLLRPGNPTLRAILAECADGAMHLSGLQSRGYQVPPHARLGYRKANLATGPVAIDRGCPGDGCDTRLAVAHVRLIILIGPW